MGIFWQLASLWNQGSEPKAQWMMIWDNKWKINKRKNHKAGGGGIVHPPGAVVDANHILRMVCVTVVARICVRTMFKKIWSPIHMKTVHEG